MDKTAQLPAWSKRIGDLETVFEIAARLAFAYDHAEIKVEDSRSLIWVTEDLHDLFVSQHNPIDATYWEDFCFAECVDNLVGDFLACLTLEPDWINTKHHSMYGKETVEDLLKRHHWGTDQWKSAGK